MGLSGARLVYVKSDERSQVVAHYDAVSIFHQS